MPLAGKVARRYWNSSLPREDLTQVANLALVKAIDRFDADRGSAFEAFAVPTILGELRCYFRDSSWAVHVARGAQERSKAMQDAIELLSREHGRPPTVVQLALYLEFSEADVLDALQVANAYTAGSLDAPLRTARATRPRSSPLLERKTRASSTSRPACWSRVCLETLSDREQRLLRCVCARADSDTDWQTAGCLSDAGLAALPSCARTSARPLSRRRAIACNKKA
jgi:RNA polymerase sigma factor (sigma-70 family)